MTSAEDVWRRKRVNDANPQHLTMAPEAKTTLIRNTRP